MSFGRKLAAIVAAAVVASLSPISAAPASAADCDPGTRVRGAIRDVYVSLGGPCGLLGVARSYEHPTATRYGAYQVFARGEMYWSPSTYAHEIHGGILATWKELGGEHSVVGFPVTNEAPTSKRPGAVSHFERGSIYWSGATGAREVRGAIRDRWLGLNGEGGSLGFPTSNEAATAHRPGAIGWFEGGLIAWSPGTGAQPLYRDSGIVAKWVQMGAENSPLGFPTGRSNYFAPYACVGEQHHFEGGFMYGCVGGQAYEVHGAIWQAYKQAGALDSRLRQPISDEYAIPGGRRSDFAGGHITWTPEAGTKVVVNA